MLSASAWIEAAALRAITSQSGAVSCLSEGQIMGVDESRRSLVLSDSLCHVECYLTRQCFEDVVSSSGVSLRKLEGATITSVAGRLHTRSLPYRYAPEFVLLVTALDIYGSFGAGHTGSPKALSESPRLQAAYAALAPVQQEAVAPRLPRAQADVPRRAGALTWAHLVVPPACQAALQTLAASFGVTYPVGGGGGGAGLTGASSLVSSSASSASVGRSDPPPGSGRGGEEVGGAAAATAAASVQPLAAPPQPPAGAPATAGGGHGKRKRDVIEDADGGDGGTDAHLPHPRVVGGRVASAHAAAAAAAAEPALSAPASPAPLLLPAGAAPGTAAGAATGANDDAVEGYVEHIGYGGLLYTAPDVEHNEQPHHAHAGGKSRVAAAAFPEVVLELRDAWSDEDEDASGGDRSASAPPPGPQPPALDVAAAAAMAVATESVTTIPPGGGPHSASQVSSALVHTSATISCASSSSSSSSSSTSALMSPPVAAAGVLPASPATTGRKLGGSLTRPLTRPGVEHAWGATTRGAASEDGAEAPSSLLPLHHRDGAEPPASQSSSGSSGMGEEGAGRVADGAGRFLGDATPFPLGQPHRPSTTGGGGVALHARGAGGGASAAATPARFLLLEPRGVPPFDIDGGSRSGDLAGGNPGDVGPPLGRRFALPAGGALPLPSPVAPSGTQGAHTQQVTLLDDSNRPGAGSVLVGGGDGGAQPVPPASRHGLGFAQQTTPSPVAEAEVVVLFPHLAVGASQASGPLGAGELHGAAAADTQEPLSSGSRGRWGTLAGGDGGGGAGGITSASGGLPPPAQLTPASAAATAASLGPLAAGPRIACDGSSDQAAGPAVHVGGAAGGVSKTQVSPIFANESVRFVERAQLRLQAEEEAEAEEAAAAAVAAGAAAATPAAQAAAAAATAVGTAGDDCDPAAPTLPPGVGLGDDDAGGGSIEPLAAVGSAAASSRSDRSSSRAGAALCGDGGDGGGEGGSAPLAQAHCLTVSITPEGSSSSRILSQAASESAADGTRAGAHGAPLPPAVGAISGGGGGGGGGSSESHHYAGGDEAGASLTSPAAAAAAAAAAARHGSSGGGPPLLGDTRSSSGYLASLEDATPPSSGGLSPTPAAGGGRRGRSA